MPTDIKDEHYAHLTPTERREVNELLDDVDAWRKRVRTAQTRIRQIKDVARKRHQSYERG